MAQIDNERAALLAQIARDARANAANLSSQPIGYIWTAIAALADAVNVERENGGMGPIVMLEGNELDQFLTDLRGYTGDARPYRMRFAIDDGIKVKVNEGTWSVNMGQVQ